MASLREASYGSTRVGLYEPIKEYMGFKNKIYTPFWAKFTAAFLSGSLAATFFTPFDV